MRQINSCSIWQIGRNVIKCAVPLTYSVVLAMLHEKLNVNAVEARRTSFWVDFRVLTSCGFVDWHWLVGGISVNLTLALHPGGGGSSFI